MSRRRPRATARGRSVVVVALTALLATSAAPLDPPGPIAPTVVAAATPLPAIDPVVAPESAVPTLPVVPVVPAALVDEGLDLRAGPVPVAMALRLPSLGVAAPLVGVGLTPGDVMDAPMGPDDDPVWQEAFWYRGSAVPGAASTALVAGHVIDSAGRPALFAELDRLRPGDPIVVVDQRDGLEVRFTVTGAETLSLEEAASAEALTRMYGAGPVAGTGPQPSLDGEAHLTLVTCAGTFRRGTHDHRLVVYATRTG